MMIHGLVTASKANGPGDRVVLYFQGCTLGCRGCWNPETHRFSGREVTANAVAQHLIGIAEAQTLEGITFSGGEPMQQTHDLLATIRAIHTSAPALSIGMYSGYSLVELEAGHYQTRQANDCVERARLWQQIREDLDFAVLGRYVESRPGDLPLRSSSNQELKIFTARYSTADFTPFEVEVQIGSEGLVQITGFPLLGIPA